MKVGIGFLSKALDLPLAFIRSHEILLGLHAVRTKGGHRRYDLDEVKLVSQQLAQQKMAEAQRMSKIWLQQNDQGTWTERTA